jgi:hypothetical protein
MKNFVERCFHPVMEYLFTRDQSYSIVILSVKGEKVHLITVKSTSGWMSRDKKVQSPESRVQSKNPKALGSRFPGSGIVKKRGPEFQEVLFVC